jgi:prepilin-type N-terminal cleavage/methylation domain-containing protein
MDAGHLAVVPAAFHDRVMPPKNHGKGFPAAGAFTLTELLVVIAVILVLSALLVPALRAIRDRAMLSQCLSRINNLNAALMEWTRDNGQRFPSLETPEYGNADTGIWFGYARLLLPYLGMSEAEAESQPRVFSCPLVRNSVKTPSYIFNGGNQYDPSFPGLAGVVQASVAEPSRTITLYEVAAVFPTSWHKPPPKGGKGVYNNAPSVAAFADGHADFIPFHWDGASLSPSSDPPAGYSYRWSAR